MRRHLLPAVSLAAALALAGCGASQSIASSTPAPTSKAAAADPAADDTAAAAETEEAEDPKPEGVYAFGDTVVFDDGSKLTISKPVKFRPAEFASGGEKSKYHVKVKITFTNKSGEVFDPTLTTVKMSSADEEGEEVYQDGFDTPSNKLLPGKKVSWSAGFGIKSAKSQTVTVSMGMLDYADAIFTNDA